LKALAAALVKAQLAAEAVGKDSTNTFHKYKYASAEAMLAEGRQALASAGLALYQRGWEVDSERSVITVFYTLLHDSGERIGWAAQTSIVPDKGRPQDKAEAAALTYSIAYAIRGLLLLPRVDETASVDARDDRHHEPPPRRRVDRDGVVDAGPMGLTSEAEPAQVLRAIQECPPSDTKAIGAWIREHGNDFMPEDLERMRAAYKARLDAKLAPKPEDAAAKEVAKNEQAPREPGED
jgi:hypothetical protein